jgi:hypothetical protein
MSAMRMAVIMYYRTVFCIPNVILGMFFTKRVPITKFSYGEFWDTNTQGPDIKVDHLGSWP